MPLESQCVGWHRFLSRTICHPYPYPPPNRVALGKVVASKSNSLQLTLDICPVSKTEPHIQFLFSSGTGAFIQGVTAELPDREFRPSIQTPETFDTGFVLPFT